MSLASEHPVFDGDAVPYKLAAILLEVLTSCSRFVLRLVGPGRV